MARKKKMLPKNFEELLEAGDLEALKNVFNTCEFDAYYNDYSKKTAFAFDLCPDELAKWLIEQGADINKTDYYGYTPLCNRSSSCWRGNINGLLELGADLTISKNGKTPLHAAAGNQCFENTELLLQFGAKINQKDEDGLSPLEYALQQCMPAYIKETLKVAELLLESGAKNSKKTKKYIKEIGEDFEFYRDDYSKTSVDTTSSALDNLYKLFQVPPVPRRVVYDNKSEIILSDNLWRKQHVELWNMLVPGSGHAATVQGEVIRISGRIADETERNGGANWDVDYKKMGQAYINLISTGEPLSVKKVNKAKSILSSEEKRQEKYHLLQKYAVEWIGQNTMPIEMVKPDYKR